MATGNTRQRKLARAKLDRQLAKRAEQERRTRQIRAVVAGSVVLVVAIVGGLWLGGVFKKEAPAAPAAQDCTWNPQNVSANTNLKDVGVPRTNGIVNAGINLMTVTFNGGAVKAELDRSLARCGSEALAFLGSSGYFNNTTCHELTEAYLRCGDHSGSGDGGAAFTWVPENVPGPVEQQPTTDPSAAPGASAAPTVPTSSAAPTASADPSAPPTPSGAVRYPQGTVAMQPGLTGSQFIIFFKDSSIEQEYSIVGRVTTGLDVVMKIAEKGAVDNGKGANTKPKEDVTIQSLTVVDPESQPPVDPSAVPSTEPSTEPSGQPSPTAAPSS